MQRMQRVLAADGAKSSSHQTPVAERAQRAAVSPARPGSREGEMRVRFPSKIQLLFYTHRFVFPGWRVLGAFATAGPRRLGCCPRRLHRRVAHQQTFFAGVAALADLSCRLLLLVALGIAGRRHKLALELPLLRFLTAGKPRVKEEWIRAVPLHPCTTANAPARWGYPLRIAPCSSVAPPCCWLPSRRPPRPLLWGPESRCVGGLGHDFQRTSPATPLPLCTKREKSC